MFAELVTYPALERPDLLAPVTLEALRQWPNPGSEGQFEVAEIDPAYSDTGAFCEHFRVPVEQTANTVIVEAKRAGENRLAVVVLPAAGRADLNGVVRKALDARRLSLASRAVALELSRMEYGSITAIGLPPDWPLIVDARVIALPRVLMGGGLRKSKLIFPGKALAELENVQIIHDMAH